MAVVIGNAELTDDELHTVVVGVEGLLNSRPLSYQSADAADPTPLTPNHFLVGMSGDQLSPEPEDKSDAVGLRKLWRRIQNVIRQFWESWLKEVVPGLHPRSKWRAAQKDLTEGDVVLVVEPDLPRGRWALGRITKVFPGPDGHVRAVDVNTRGSVYRRPIQRVCPLEV